MIFLEDVTFTCTYECIVSLVALGSGNSDAGHSCDDVILLDGPADRSLELIHVLAAGLLHDLAHSRLAHLKRFQGVCFRGELLAAAVHPTMPREIDLSQRKLALRVLARVDLTQHLQVCKPVCLFLVRSGEFAIVLTLLSIVSESQSQFLLLSSRCSHF